MHPRVPRVLLLSICLMPALSSAPLAPAAAPANAALAGAASVPSAARISPTLRALADAQPKGEVWAMVVSQTALDVTSKSTIGTLGTEARQFVWPSKQHVAVLRVKTARLTELASLPGVLAVRSAEEGIPPTNVTMEDHSLLLPRAQSPAARQAALRAAPPWSAPPETEAPGASSVQGGPAAADQSTTGWFDVRKGHAGQEAWALGYRGQGVRVAVVDNAVDFAHPDLQDTWAVLPDSSPYAGWPQVFDPNVGLLALEESDAPPSARSSRRAASGMIEMYQTSAVTVTQEGGVPVYTACFRPGVFGAQAPFQLADPDCGYRVPGTSKSGVLRYGHHPDSLLRARGDLGQGIDGQWAGVLLVDEAEAGRYDTVYVDTDADRDFTDEKPMTEASPLGWRDITGDGIADVSAGLLYWISDGVNPFPVSWAWGLDDQVPAAGTAIGILYANDGDHGTLCASNIASRGVLGVPPDRQLAFRDLPDGQPTSTNSGLAPEAEVVSVGDVYASDALFQVAWTYLAFGHDPDSPDDDIQVASNSYGFSDVDNDGWDADSRTIDYLVRTYNPNLSFLVATGNGAPGYGTVTAPKPTVGLGIAASTQMGSTGSDMLGGAVDSITDTTQITFGDIVSWSNRGPGADGTVGVQLAADGADASGGVPINTATDGAHANATWSGTSRSTPVASGAMALVYQAFRARTGQWPTWQEARSVIMAGARFNGYDGFTTGAGVLDAADAVRIAAGLRGIYATPSEWTPGDYHGTQYPAFAHLVGAGQVVTSSISLHNPTNKPITVRLSAQTLRRIGSDTGTLVTNPAAESPPSDVPDYLVPLDRQSIPADTDLLVARAIFPMDEFDPDGDYSSDDRLYMTAIQHTDVNGDGLLWSDKNGNGVVDHAQLGGAYVRVEADGAEQDIPAVEGYWISRPVPSDGVTAPMAWFGSACDGQAPAQDVIGKVALVERGTCRFVEKVANAERAGAAGVVVFSDERPAAIMFALPTGLKVPALMIAQTPGAGLRDRLVAGQAVTATMAVRRDIGLDGSPPIVWSDTEMERYEYMRFNGDFSDRNNFAVAVHHPLQRWADGIWLAFWHVDPATAVGAAVSGAPSLARHEDLAPASATQTVSPTHVALRIDYYAYRPWPALQVPESVVVPAHGTADVEARLSVPADAAPGELQGAIFADYDRTVSPTAAYLPTLSRNAPLGQQLLEEAPQRVPLSARESGAGQADTTGGQTGDGSLLAASADSEAPLLPGGYELPFLRTTIPVNVNVAADYGWQGALSLGGPAQDLDASYDNGASQGAFTWDWREESGDWRFFFLDAAQPEAPMRWLFRTTWQDPNARQADIDTRFYGPAPDPFTQGDDQGNQLMDTAWYGPYTLGLYARSPYLVRGGTVWPFDTSSGANEDWVAAPALTGGLHEVMLDNVLFSGTQFDMPFQTQVGSVELSSDEVTLAGSACNTLELTPTLPLADLQVTAYGMSSPIELTEQPVTQDDPDSVASTTFRYRLSVPTEAGRFAVSLTGQPDDDLDLYVLYDADGDGQFSFSSEVVGQSAGPTADESVELEGVAPAGDYEVWVHGYAVMGADSTFDLLIDVVSGDSLTVRQAPSAVPADASAQVEVCADPAGLDPSAASASGLLYLGPATAPRLLEVPVQWQPAP